MILLGAHSQYGPRTWILTSGSASRESDLRHPEWPPDTRPPQFPKGGATTASGCCPPRGCRLRDAPRCSAQSRGPVCAAYSRQRPEKRGKLRKEADKEHDHMMLRSTKVRKWCQCLEMGSSSVLTETCYVTPDGPPFDKIKLSWPPGSSLCWGFDSSKENVPLHSSCLQPACLNQSFAAF